MSGQPPERCGRRAAQAGWTEDRTLLISLGRKGYWVTALLLLLGSGWLLSRPLLAASFLLSAPPERPPSMAVVSAATVPQERTGLTVNPGNRQESLAFYQRHYLSSAESDIAWTGQLSSCEAGTTAPAFQAAMVRRINYFRAMAGVPAAVTLSDDYNHKAQAAALMMSANQQLSHHPAPDWRCYTPDGATAAQHANLLLGGFSPSVIDDYIADAEESNAAVGHRRWLLYPPTQHMGTGAIPPTAPYPAANVLWVVDEDAVPLRPATRESFVAWPPPGFVPAAVVFPRWSFSYPEADFSAAAISMTVNGQALPLHMEPVTAGFGENTLVWVPEVDQEASVTQAAADIVYQVQINQVQVAGQAQAFTYTVTVFDPNAAVVTPGELPTNSATSMPTATLMPRETLTTPPPATPTPLATSTLTIPPTAAVPIATSTPLPLAVLTATPARVYLAIVSR